MATSLLWALRSELVRLDAVPANRPFDGIIGAEPHRYTKNGTVT
jgi:hypothetical protein